MKVGQQRINTLKVVTGRNKQVGFSPAGSWQALALPGCRLKTAHHGGANGHHTPALAPGFCDLAAGRFTHLVVFVMHDMVSQLFSPYRLKGSRAHMQGNKGRINFTV